MNARVATIAVSVTAATLLAFTPQPVVTASTIRARDTTSLAVSQGNRPQKVSEMATMTALPRLAPGSGAEPLAINSAGTVIVGSAWDQGDLLYGVTWTQQNGKWTITALPTPPDATSAIARGVGNTGAAGNDFPGNRSRAIFWPWTGGYQVLGCIDDVGPATVYGISGDGQTVVGGQQGAAVWQPGNCRINLPRLGGGSSGAAAVNADGTVIGGVSATTVTSDPVPVRWTFDGLWHIQPLDTRPGSVRGSNGVGDLAGSVTVPYGAAGCVLEDGCTRGVIWYAAGGAVQLGTLGGAHSWTRDLNASGEVVGLSTSPQVGNTAFFWSPSVGMYQLPFKGQWAGANAVSDVRPDGTRLVVGQNSSGAPLVWVVRNP